MITIFLEVFLSERGVFLYFFFILKIEVIALSLAQEKIENRIINIEIQQN